MKMMKMNDDDNDNNGEIWVEGNAKHVLSIRTSLSCYKSKVKKKNSITNGKTARTICSTIL